ncbi:MAG: Dabb family protein [Actinomycetota bacterium]|nr:Dabb family protein [Actinomycetota bacterium]
MLRHVSLLTLSSDADFDAIEHALRALPARLPQLLDYRVGRDAGIDEGNTTFAVVADFEDAEGYLVYRDDPEHKRIAAELIRPHLQSRAAAQYEIWRAS